MHVDLDYVYDPDPAQQTQNINRLIQRVYDMKISHVFLQAFADPQGDGRIKALYFPNRRLPVRADLFNFVSGSSRPVRGESLRVDAGALVRSRFLPAARAASGSSNGPAARATEPYIRLSPWNPQVRQQVTDIYEDLARYSTFNGILFHDDAVLTDVDDAGQDAPQYTTRQKSRLLMGFTRALGQAVKHIRGPQIKTARNMFVLPIPSLKAKPGLHRILMIFWRPMTGRCRWPCR